MRTPKLAALSFALLFIGCGGSGSSPDTPESSDSPARVQAEPTDPKAPKKRSIQAPTPAEKAPAASPRLKAALPVESLTSGIASWFERTPGQRTYIQVDKPIYKPGETIWFTVWDLKAKDLSATQHSGHNCQLISPKGAVVLSKRIRQNRGRATNDFQLPGHVQGGEYILRVNTQGRVVDRPVLVSAYEAPRIKKKLEFIRKAYGAGDTVKATLRIKRPTGEALGNHPVTAAIRLDGIDLPRVSTTTNADGGAIITFPLPAQIQRGDALLTVLISDGGITESISKRVPILMKKMQLSFFPEGGTSIEGLPARVYFEAKNMLNKPADIEGRIVDDHGNAVAKFRTFDRGLGQIQFTPATGRIYHAQVTRPAGITEKYALPLANKEGCALRTYNDFDGQEAALRVGIRCTEAQTVVVAGTIRDRLLDAAAIKVSPGSESVVHLLGKDGLAKAQGVTRVTLFNETLAPLAERVVFRNRRTRLNVKVEPNAKSYTPRAPVELKITTTDASGAPIAAQIGVSVVDDTVISFADDKTPHILSTLLVTPEIPGKIEEPNFYFDLTEAKSGQALDMLMGTRGYRRFDWQTALRAPAVAVVTKTAIAAGASVMDKTKEVRKAEDQDDFAPRKEMRLAVNKPRAAPAKKRAKAKGPRQPMRREAKPMPAPAPVVMAEIAAEPMPMDDALARDKELAGEMADEEAPQLQAGLIGKADRAWAGNEGGRGAGGMKKKMARRGRRRLPSWAPTRVFPTPSYSAEYQGPRTDFRETLFWAPNVDTDETGHATLSFPTSDAVTSFRIFAEGIGGGQVGRSETVFKSSLPFSMNVKIPLEVSAGDRIDLPLTLTNEVDRTLPLNLQATFGDLLTVKAPPSLKSNGLPAKDRASMFYGIEVTGQRGEAVVSFSADAGGLKDSYERTVKITPLGFPKVAEASGTLTESASHTFDLGDAKVATVDASLRLYPSPVATMLQGVAGLIREPHGCFEQTSSTHYPNVMVMNYLKATGKADPALIARLDRVLDKGYKRLTGFEVKQKGYEWFGRAPAHEALTAYGLLEFSDMRGIYAVDENMIARTVAWLKARRDGKGGFKRDGKALDTFGRAKPETTNAYICWAIAEAGLADQFSKEMDAIAKLGSSTQDAYLLALAANTLLKIPTYRAAGLSAAKRLVAMQDASGAWISAQESITRSGGKNLHIETTALAMLALLEGDVEKNSVRKAVDWLQKNRGGFGQWGATQATVLAIKAMSTYAMKSRAAEHAGSVEVLVNGTSVSTQKFGAGHTDPLEFANLGKYFKPGKNTIELRGAGGNELPYSIAIDYRTLKPASAEDAAVQVETSLAKTTLKMGEAVRLTATIKNRTDQGQPMTVARIGLPGGLTFQNWQLKELREKGLIAFFETRPREVVLYFDQLKPNAEKTIPLDLVAQVPGQYTGPATSAYLYYTNDKQWWADGVKVTVTR